jgi:hypothetical protein
MKCEVLICSQFLFLLIFGLFAEVSNYRLKKSKILSTKELKNIHKSHNYLELSHLTNGEEDFNISQIKDIDNSLDFHSFIEFNYLTMDL